MLPELFIQQLKQSCDMERIVSGYLPLKKKGRYLVGLCPFHSEKSPSFYVYPQNQSFYCFGCGAGGDVITFIRRIENLEYMEAVKLLADRCGLELPMDSDQSDERSMLKKRVLEINRESARFFHSCLCPNRADRRMSTSSAAAGTARPSVILDWAMHRQAGTDCSTTCAPRVFRTTICWKPMW